MNARHLAAAASMLLTLQSPAGAQQQPALNGYAVRGLLGAGGDYRGAFVGRSVTVRRRSRVREASAFPPA